jgi:hypothetical protein
MEDGEADGRELGGRDIRQGDTEGGTSDTGADGGAQDGGQTGDERLGLEGVRAESRFAREVTVPSCDESRSSVKIIDEEADWEAINDEQYETFCVRPGNYRDYADRIELTASGSEGNRRRIVYDGPVDVPPINQTESQRAIVDGIHLESGASYWTISGLTVDTRDDQTGRNAVLGVADGAEHNIFDRMLASGPEGQYINRLITKIRGDYTTVQNSVLRNTRNPGSDRNCIDVNDDRVRGTRIVSNELYDCTDSVQLVIASGDSLRYYPETLIAHNDMYHSTAFRTDGQGNFDEEGDWTCGENAIDIKGAAEGWDEAIRVIGNRMWGYSDTDENCGGSGSGPFSKAVTVHHAGDASTGPRYVEFRNNIIFETATGIAFERTRHVTVENNLFHSYGFRDGNGSRGYGLMAFVVQDATFTGNTFTGGRYWMKAYNDSSVELEETVLVDAGESGTGSGSPTVQASGTASYGESTPWAGSANIERDAPKASNNEEFCVMLRGYSSPRRRCFEHAVSTSESPHGAGVGFSVPEP